MLYTKDTSKVARKMSGEFAQRTIVREHKRIPTFDDANLEVSIPSYTEDTLKVDRKMSGEFAQRTIVREHKRTPTFDDANLEVSKVYRYKITIEYIGTGLCGMQKQKNALSIQEAIENAIYSFSKERVTIYASGRTDAGVHALAQVAHFDLSQNLDGYNVAKSINHFLGPRSIRVIDCTRVDIDFHARFSAKMRHYLYRIINRSGALVIDFDRAWHIKDMLDIEKMQKAANYLIGTHDFTSFRALHCQAKSPIKTLSNLSIERINNEIRFYFSAPSFLHHMVRNIMGSLVFVGLSKWEPEYIQILLNQKNRALAGPTAPACGLYFVKTDY